MGILQQTITKDFPPPNISTTANCTQTILEAKPEMRLAPTKLFFTWFQLLATPPSSKQKVEL